MSDDFTKTREALEQIEQADRDRYAPEQPAPQTPAETYAAALAAARSKTAFTVDAAWLVR